MILHMLRANARLTDEQIARRLGLSVEEVRETITHLEDSHAIVGYKAIVNPELVDDGLVDAIIEVKVVPKRGHGFDQIAKRIGGFAEVKSLYLMSGGTDFLLFMEAPSIKEVAYFVTEKLATQEDVQSTTTHFILKVFKKDGTVLHGNDLPERLAVSP